MTRLLRRREEPHFSHDLAHGTNMRESIERDGDVEMILQLSDELEHLQRIETEICQQLAVGRRTRGPSFQPCKDLERIALESIDGGRFYGRDTRPRGVNYSGNVIGWILTTERVFE